MAWACWPLPRSTSAMLFSLVLLETPVHPVLAWRFAAVQTQLCRGNRPRRISHMRCALANYPPLCCRTCPVPRGPFNNSAPLVGVGTPSLPPPPPPGPTCPLKYWAQFSSRPSADHKFSSAPSAPLKNHHHWEGWGGWTPPLQTSPACALRYSMTTRGSMSLQRSTSSSPTPIVRTAA